MSCWTWLNYEHSCSRETESSTVFNGGGFSSNACAGFDVMNREHTSHVQQHQVKIRSHCSLQPLVVFRCLQWIRCGLHSAWKAVNKIQGLLFLHLKFGLWNLSAEEHSFVQNCQRTRQLCCTMPSQHASHVQPHRTFQYISCSTSTASSNVLFLSLRHLLLSPSNMFGLSTFCR